MSIFYLMPPRPFLAERFADFLQTYFPGLAWDVSARSSLIELLGSTIGERDGVYLVYRDELPCGEAAAQALRDGFGAEVGDEVVEVRPGGRFGEVYTRRWRIEGESEREGAFCTLQRNEGTLASFMPTEDNTSWAIGAAVGLAE